MCTYYVIGHSFNKNNQNLIKAKFSNSSKKNLLGISKYMKENMKATAVVPSGQMLLD